MGVGHLCSDDFDALFVLFGAQMALHSWLGDEVASAGNAVVLAQTRLVLVQFLILQLGGLFGQHIYKDDLVDVSGRGRPLCLARLAVLFVI